MKEAQNAKGTLWAQTIRKTEGKCSQCEHKRATRVYAANVYDVSLTPGDLRAQLCSAYCEKCGAKYILHCVNSVLGRKEPLKIWEIKADGAIIEL